MKNIGTALRGMGTIRALLLLFIVSAAGRRTDPIPRVCVSPSAPLPLSMVTLIHWAVRRCVRDIRTCCSVCAHTNKQRLSSQNWVKLVRSLALEASILCSTILTCCCCGIHKGATLGGGVRRAAGEIKKVQQDSYFLPGDGPAEPSIFCP